MAKNHLLRVEITDLDADLVKSVGGKSYVITVGGISSGVALSRGINGLRRTMPVGLAELPWQKITHGFLDQDEFPSHVVTVEGEPTTTIIYRKHPKPVRGVYPRPATKKGVSKNPNRKWSDEDDKILRQGWREGVHTLAIAAKIGDKVNRTMVIGRAHRLGLGPHPNSNQYTRRQQTFRRYG